MAVGARGISVIYASGDGGVRGGHDTLSQCTSNTFLPVFPASCPFVTAVGSTIGVNPERAINFTGGGFSAIFARPSYQTTVVPQFLATIPSNFPGTFTSTGRGYPDVSINIFLDVLFSGLKLPSPRSSRSRDGTSMLSPVAIPAWSGAPQRPHPRLRALFR